MLTPKQEKFVQNIIQGMSQAEAYRNSYDTTRMSDKTIWEHASRLMAKDKVEARIKEIRDTITQKNVMSAQERLEWLTSLIQDNKVSISDKLKASDQMNKMQGEYTQKLKAEVSYEDNLRAIVSEDEY